MKFYGGIVGGERNKWLDFGSNPDHHANSWKSDHYATNYERILLKFSE